MTPEEREYAVIKNTVRTLAVMCSGSTDKIIDLLTGYLWEPDEAKGIKKSDGKWYLSCGEKEIDMEGK